MVLVEKLSFTVRVKNTELFQICKNPQKHKVLYTCELYQTMGYEAILYCLFVSLPHFSSHSSKVSNLLALPRHPP